MPSSCVRPLLALCAGTLLALAATAARALDTTGTPTPVTGNATWFTALGSPYGGCGLPQDALDSQGFVALNVYNTPGDYSFYPRPLTGANLAKMGLWNNGHNCGRWVRVTMGDNCTGVNDGARNQPFCRNGSWVSDGYDGATLDMVVADSCGDDNGWCRDDPYHLDLAQGALNLFQRDGAPVGDLYPAHWNNRHITWEFIPAPGYAGDITIGFLQGGQSWWGAIAVTHLPNGIHGVEYQQNGTWTAAEMDGDMGQAFIVKPLTPGGTDFQIRVRDVTDALIFDGRTYSFSLPASCGTQCSTPFTPVTYTTSSGTGAGVTLTVAKDGSGSGTVTSTPAGVSCGATCSATFDAGALVTLTAAAGTDSRFSGWSGACTGSTTTCTLTLSAAQSVTATFAAVVVDPYTLTVTKVGAGSGWVSSSTGGISCGTVCSAGYAPGTLVTLTATPAAGTSWAGWGGACSGTSSVCVVTMNAAQTVSANFATCCTTYTLTVAKAGTGSGTIASTPAGISCGATCSAAFSSGQSVTLTAASTSGSTFTGWSGACTGSGLCVLSMTASRSVTATFTGTCGAASSSGSAPSCGEVLTVMKAGGSGVVTSTPAGISCGSTCSAVFGTGVTVTLTATPASGTSFSGWSGACTGTGTCVLSMTGSRSVTATFGSCCTLPATLTVAKTGTGSGTVTSSPQGISCGTRCVNTDAQGKAFTLTAQAAEGSIFTGWSGACSGTGLCVVSMNADTAVTAVFDLPGGPPCVNPITFTGNTSNFDSAGAVCYRTAQTVNGWGCSNFAGRTVSVNGGTASATCGAGPFPLAKSPDGYTYFGITAGTYTWANLYVW